MKKIVILSIALIIGFSAQAQVKFGVKGGWDFENFDISGSIGNQLKKKNSTSWNLGIMLQLPLSSNLFLQPEALYSSQKLTFKETDSFQPKYNDAKMSYIVVPVNLMYKMNLVLVQPYAFAGPYWGFAIDRKHIAKDNISSVDWGVNLGVGVELWKFQFSAKYNWALKNISDVDNLKWKNNKFAVSIGYFF